MRRYLRLFLCLPLLATTACAADAIAGPELAPEPELEAAVQAAPEPRAVKEAAPAPGPVFLCRASSRSIHDPPREPLYIVDGVVVLSLASVDAKDIESVEVLKGTAAASLYGTRAVRGVVIVTTRSGAALSSRRR